mgnify:CR=1 FL=1
MQEFEDILNEFDEVTGEQKPVVFATFVMDHSGSMTGDRDMCISNFNEQIQSMKSKTEVSTYFTQVDFSDWVQVTGPYPIDYVSELTDYQTYGTTALNDAIAKAIEINKKMMEESKIKDKSSLIIVVTDGQENASSNFSGADGTEKLQDIIKKLQAQGDWTFTFMAADLQVQRYATQSLGIDAGNTMCFEKTSMGYDALNKTTLRGLDSYYDMRVRGGMSTNDFTQVSDGTDASGKWSDGDSADISGKLTDEQYQKMIEEAVRRLSLEVDDGDEKERADD